MLNKSQKPDSIKAETTNCNFTSSYKKDQVIKSEFGYIKRRELFEKLIKVGALALFFPKKLLATPIEDLLKLQNPYQDLLYKIHGWYCKNFFNFEKELSTYEKEYILSVFKSLDNKSLFGNNFTKQQQSLITYSHRLNQGKWNHSRLAVCSNLEGTRKLALNILKHRGIKLPSSMNKDFWGLGWDFESNHFKIYFQNFNILTLKEPSHQFIHELYSKTKQVSFIDYGMYAYTDLPPKKRTVSKL